MIGLSTSQAREKLAHYGHNRLPEPEGDGLVHIFLRQFQSPFIYVLLVAALVSFSLGQTINGIFIFVVLFINASIGAIQEYSAQRAAVALRKMVPQFAAVFRDGIICRIDAEQLVVGDVVQLASGDRIPADMRIQQCQNLLIDESLLTGESLASSKQVGAQVTSHAPLSEQLDKLFAGTLVTHGRAQGEIIAVAEHTQIGRIATEVSVKETVKPPLLQRIERFTLLISYGVLILIALLFLITLIRGEDLTTVFLLGVALAVSAIPEGLPAAITIALAIGMRRMSRKHVIVRKLVAVESLGSCTYIASDKTGTLTVNEMTVKKIVTPDGREFDVGGEGIDVHGDISGEGVNHTIVALEPLIRSGLVANEASLTGTNGHWRATGDGVDLALLVLAGKYGLDFQRVRSSYPELAAIPYESENAYSASINRVAGGITLHIKGSTEKILSLCTKQLPSHHLNIDAITRQTESLARQGYRVLAFAEKALSEHSLDPKQELHGLTFLGLVGMIDPLRAEAKAAVAHCRQAHIEVAMVTGDHPLTAKALASQLGIIEPGADAVTGPELMAAKQSGVAALDQLIQKTRVFARVEPAQKLLIVERLIQQGHYVAVTGDGVNDAPALHNAHVGIAMGKRGSDVARESSDLIITDDNFASIVEGVKQGRIVYNNIRKVVFLLISTGAAEILLFILSIVFALPIPLFPIQLLWLNLVTNGIQDVALAFEPAEGDELNRQPRSPNETIFNRLMVERVLINALVMGSLAFAVFSWLLHQQMSTEQARNLTLLLMVLFENVHVLNSRSETRSVFHQRFWGNPLLIMGMLTAQCIHIGAMYTPGLNDVLQIEPVTLNQWLALLPIALLLIVVDELHKWWLNRQRVRPSK